MIDFLWKFAYAFVWLMVFYIFHKVLVLIYEAWKFNSEIGYHYGERKKKEHE